MSNLIQIISELSELLAKLREIKQHILQHKLYPKLLDFIRSYVTRAYSDPDIVDSMLHVLFNKEIVLEEKTLPFEKYGEHRQDKIVIKLTGDYETDISTTIHELHHIYQEVTVPYFEYEYAYEYELHGYEENLFER